MKKTLILVCAALLAAAMLGCTGNKLPTTPAPMVSPTVKPSPVQTIVPTPTAAVSPTAEASPTAGTSPAAGNETIEGFKEGEKIEPDKLPEKVTAAIKEKYADAKITGATYATYMEGQTYLVTLSGAGEGVDKVYVNTDGTIIPYKAQSTAKP